MPQKVYYILLGGNGKNGLTKSQLSNSIKKMFSNENLWDFKDLARGGSAAVEHLTKNLKFKGLIPACCNGRDHNVFSNVL